MSLNLYRPKSPQLTEPRSRPQPRFRGSKRFKPGCCGKTLKAGAKLVPKK